MLERMQKYGLLVCLMLLGTVAPAQPAVQLNVSATIPPRPCEYPNPCEPVAQSATTSVSVDEEIIRYVGSPPSVAKKDDLLIVNF
jgi:hypothetical protein